MNTILNKVTFSKHSLLIDFSDLATMMSILDSYDLTWKKRIYFGNCGWAKAPNCWFVIFRCSDYVWYKMLVKMKECKITLLPEYVGYVGY